jgi:hypothetical protein
MLEYHIRYLHPEGHDPKGEKKGTEPEPVERKATTGARAAFELDRKIFLDNKPENALPYETPAGYTAWRYPDGTMRSGPIGDGSFGERACNPDPPQFCGKREDFLGWWRKMGIKIRSDTICFPTAAQQVDFIFLRLGGPAAEYYDDTLPEDPGTFFDELGQLFGDPHQHEKARRIFDDLSKSRQWINEPGIDFHIRIKRMARQADVILDTAAIHMRLNPKWKNALALRLVDPGLRANQLLGLLRDGSFVLDDPDHTRINMAGPQGRPYVPPRHDCPSNSKCVCALSHPMPMVAAAGFAPVDWSTYPDCPRPSHRPMVPPEFLGDLRTKRGLRDALKKAGRCEKCRGIGAPHCWGRKNEETNRRYDETGAGFENGVAIPNDQGWPEEEAGPNAPFPIEAGQGRGTGQWRGRRGRGRGRGRSF